MQRNEYLLAFFLALLVLAGVAYESYRGGSKTAEVIITHPGKTPFDQSINNQTPIPGDPKESKSKTNLVSSTADPLLLFLNQATHNDLVQVTGIGDVYAQRILEERDITGGFHNRDQILAITGIGPAKMDNLQDHVEKLQQVKPISHPPLPQTRLQPQFNRNWGGLRSSTQQNQKINLNLATREQLMQVSGIGEHLSDEIMRERARRKGFRSWSEVGEVSGIGEKRLKQIQEQFVLN